MTIRQINIRASWMVTLSIVVNVASACEIDYWKCLGFFDPALPSLSGLIMHHGKNNCYCDMSWWMSCSIDRWLYSIVSKLWDGLDEILEAILPSTISKSFSQRLKYILYILFHWYLSNQIDKWVWALDLWNQFLWGWGAALQYPPCQSTLYFEYWLLDYDLSTNNFL